MPYVNEQKLGTFKAFRVKNVSPSGYVNYDVTHSLPTSTSTQYGWRSRGETDAAYADLRSVSTNAKWKDTLTVIEAMDRVERSLSNPIVRTVDELPVHFRTMRKDSWTYGFNILTVPDSLLERRSLWTLGLAGVPSGIFSDAEIVSKGGEIMRASRPTVPHANLGQWLGELRDFGSLFRSGLSSGSPGKVIGGAYLNWQFGWKPFIGDLQRACEAVLESDKILAKFYEDSGKISRRTRDIQLDRDVTTGVRSISTGSSYGAWNSSTLTSIAGPITFGMLSSWGTSSARGTCEYTITRQRDLRTFAKFEYFAHMPTGFAERQASYAQKARILLGLTLTPDILWELTPWSWLADWFFDIGGFLSYQVSVQEDSLVARQSGAVFYERVAGIANNYVSWTSPYRSPDPRYSPVKAISTFDTEYQRRIPMGPYGFGPTWNLTPQQWAIVGALGLTKAPKTPALP